MIPAKDSYSSLKLLYDVSRELVSALDLRTLLQRILTLSLEIVEGDTASIIIMDESGVPVDAALIVGGEIFEGTVDRLKSTLESGLAGWVVRNATPALVADTSKDERWIVRSYTDRESEGAKASVCVPLIVKEQLVGVITFTHRTVGYYTQAHLDLVQAVADQAAIAALNAQLFEASQRRADVMSVLAESAAAITASLDLTEVLNRILYQTSRSLKVEAVLLGLVDESGENVVFQAVSGATTHRQIGEHIRLGEGVAGRVAQHGESIIVSDAQKDPMVMLDADSKNGHNLRAIAAAPILSEGECIGVLEAINPKVHFTSEDMLLLRGIGGLAGTAIRHARLFEEVQIAHSRYRLLFEDSIDPVIITNWAGKVLEANRQAVKLTSFSEEELLKMQIFHFHQVDWKVVGIDYEALKVGEPVTYESDLQPKTGAAVPVAVYVHKINIGGEDRLQWIMHDITETKKLDRVREDLTSMIYHDLRSPLANVVSGLDLIRVMVPDDASVDSVVSIAERSVNRVQRLVSSLLDTSRLQAGQKITSMSLVSLNTLIVEAVDAVRPTADASNFKLEISLPEDELILMVDGDMIRRVVINLLENSLKFSNEGLMIWTGARLEGDRVLVWVKDEGRGIAKEDQEFIFDKFMQAAGEGRVTKGLGLGLAFCKLAVEGHGGEIWVESAPGEGATFTFSLPVKETQK